MTIFADNQHFIFGASRYKSGGRFGPLYESYMNLVIAHKGDVTVTSDNANYLIPEGQRRNKLRPGGVECLDRLGGVDELFPMVQLPPAVFFARGKPSLCKKGFARAEGPGRWLCLTGLRPHQYCLSS